MDTCQVDGCTQALSKSGFSFCLQHWKAERAGQVTRCERCDHWHESGRPLCRTCQVVPPTGSKAAKPTTGDADDETEGGYLSSTRIGKHFDLSGVKVNLILAELGWIEKYVKGWLPTKQGSAVGANRRETRNGVPFVVWPESILKNGALKSSIEEQSGSTVRHATATSASSTSESSASTVVPDATHAANKDDFRTKFPANFRTQDGHMVRSRAEVLIDNWLYMQGIVHAYERRLPIEEECYCDFYLPGGKGVYIEFWGLEADPKYRARKAAKQAIYTKHDLRLIELADAEIERLDDVLPRMLLKFGIESV